MQVFDGDPQFPEFADLGLQVFRDVLQRLDRSFQDFAGMQTVKWALTIDANANSVSAHRASAMVLLEERSLSLYSGLA